jgi:hypothetical protein
VGDEGGGGDEGVVDRFGVGDVEGGGAAGDGGVDGEDAAGDVQVQAGVGHGEEVGDVLGLAGDAAVVFDGEEDVGGLAAAGDERFVAILLWVGWIGEVGVWTAVPVKARSRLGLIGTAALRPQERKFFGSFFQKRTAFLWFLET